MQRGIVKFFLARLEVFRIEMKVEDRIYMVNKMS